MVGGGGAPADTEAELTPVTNGGSCSCGTTRLASSAECSRSMDNSVHSQALTVMLVANAADKNRVDLRISMTTGLLARVL